MQVHLFDDVGTTYQRQTGQVAGDGGTEWRAIWFFLPLPPVTATQLRLQFITIDPPNGTAEGQPTGSECRVRLP